MKQHISVLMDGELFDDEAEDILNGLKRNPEAQAEWETYHLISDVLRQPDHLHANIGATMHERLLAEPTVLAPRSRAGRNARWFALSAAASVLALTLVVWLSEQVGPERPAAQIAMQQSAAARPASFANNRLNDYLMAHQEFSPSADMQGTAAYIRTVADQ
jgi:sigma-E factor negative regulatory protein RseA